LPENVILDWINQAKREQAAGEQDLAELQRIKAAAHVDDDLIGRLDYAVEAVWTRCSEIEQFPEAR